MHGTEARQQHDRTADVVAGTRAILTMPRLNDCDAAKLAYIALWCEAGGRAGKVDWTKAQWAAACDRSTKCVSRWLESLERAGIVLETLAGSRTGVFLGVMHNGYASLARAPGSRPSPSAC